MQMTYSTVRFGVYEFLRPKLEVRRGQCSEGNYPLIVKIGLVYEGQHVTLSMRLRKQESASRGAS